MTNIKRIFRNTSNKILCKLGASNRAGSHSLNLENPLEPANGVIQNPRKTRSSSSKKSSNTKSHRSKSSKKDSSIPEALLIASKNYLPPVQFHHVHGPNAQLSKNKFVAKRTQSFCQALVFSNRVILPNERVYIKVLEIAKGWSGTIRFGFTSVDPATLRYRMPKHACPDMTNAGHTWARALADEVVKRKSVIHFSYNTNGYIHYGINNQDCGIFYANVNTNQNLWFIVDIYGLTASIELIDPRIHHATSDLDISRLDDEAAIGSGSRNMTMYKSTSNMDELFSQHSTRAKRKRSRKSNRHEGIIYEPWQPEGWVMPGTFGITGPQQALLPNLSSLMIPAAQQNIYSPMPTVMNGPTRNIAHDGHNYYQIMPVNRPCSSPNMDSSAVSANTSHASAGVSSALNSSAIKDVTNTANSNGRNRTFNDEQEICQQLGGLQMSDKKQCQPRIPKSTTGHPVAAARRRLQSSIAPTNSKGESEPGQRNNTKSNHSKIESSSPTNARQKIRQQVKAQKTLSSRDNNSTPPVKDCPICFERPINCVLYQCGHMCTCYECGVKQWRTQQRTCPICRTIIKDVIKTYMS